MKDTINAELSETDRIDMDDLDNICKQLGDKGQKVLRNNKRSRDSKSITPKTRTKAAKKTKCNFANNQESSCEEDPSSLEQPWVSQLLKAISDLAMTNSKLQTMITNLNTDVQLLKETNIAKDGTIKQLEIAVAARDKVIESNEERIDKLERDALNDTVIFTSSALKSRNIEESVNYICNLTQILMEEFIAESYWRKFGKNGDQVMAKFNDHTRHIKDDFFERIRGNRSNNCYISEFLTPRNNAIFYEARKLKKANRNIHSVFTFRGQVYLKLSQNSDGILIRQVSDLRQYILPAPSSLTKLDHPQPNVRQRCLQALILAYPRR